MSSVLVFVTTIHCLLSTNDAASERTEATPPTTTAAAATALAASTTEVSEVTQPNCFGNCYRRPPAFPDMTVYFRQTIEAIAAVSNETDMSLEAIFAGFNNDRLSCADSKCEHNFAKSGANCSGQVWKVNLTEINDHLCQSTLSWLQHDSDVTTRIRSEAVVKAAGLDLILVAAACIIVGVPMLSLVIGYIVKRCRSSRRHHNSPTNDSLSACQDYRQRQSVDGDASPSLNKFGNVHGLIVCRRDAGETGSARELLTSADGGCCAPRSSTPPSGNDTLSPFVFSGVVDCRNLSELSVKNSVDEIQVQTTSSAPDIQVSSKF